MKQTEVLRILPERDLCRRLLQSIYRQRIFNRPFYRYGGHIELLRFEEDYGMRRGHGHDPFTRSVLTRALLGQFLFKFPLKKDCNGKKDRCAAFGCNNDRLFPEKYTVKFSFCRKSARKY